MDNLCIHGNYYQDKCLACILRRDRFAAAALTGMLANELFTGRIWGEHQYAAAAMGYADAMIKALDNG